MTRAWSVQQIAAATMVVALGGCLSTEDPTNGEVVSADFTAVAAGDFHACGLTRDGVALCWGSNAAGQLGDSTADDSTLPVPVRQRDLVFERLGLGSAHSCAITDLDRIYCWGGNARGQLGAGLTSNFTQTPAVVAGDHEWLSVSAGGAHTCGLTLLGAAFCWGLSEGGRLGNGESAANLIEREPDAVLGGLLYTHVTAGGAHTCGLTMDQLAYCWGVGGQGQLGTGDATNSAEPAAVAGGHVFKRIAAGGEHTCALDLDARAHCWGLSSSGQLGTGSLENKDEPTPVASDLAFIEISAGGSHTCGLVGDGTVYCWGLNNTGQLGNGTTIDRSSPTVVSGSQSFLAIDAGSGLFNTATCGFARDGIAYCWGFGGFGQLGTGGTTDALVPEPVAGQTGG